MMKKKKLSASQRQELLTTIKSRFAKNMQRHKGIDWNDVEKRLSVADEDKLWSLNEMEASGGEPDVVGQDKKSGEYIFYDCSDETPKGRRSLCYDGDALRSRKENKPKGSALELAIEMGVQVLNEQQYRDLQKIGEFDMKTSSWIITPEDIRKRGGALFCDRRYGHVFTYHNGAESYYAARAFRAMLSV